MKCAKLNEPMLADLEAASTEYRAPVSQPQYSAYFLESLMDEQHHCIFCHSFRLYGQINQPAFARAVALLCQKFDILRTVYRYQRGKLQPFIQLYQADKLPFEVESVATDKIMARIQTEANQGFNLSEEWPIRLRLFTSETEQILSLTVHQIAADKYSVGLLTQALGEAYQLFCQDIDIDSDSDEIMLKSEIFSAPQYVDYSVWQQQYLLSDGCLEAKQYWTGLLKNAPSVHGLSLEFPRSPLACYDADSVEGVVKGRLFEKINQVAEQKQTSMFLLLQSLFAGFVARCSEEKNMLKSSGNRDETDLVIGSVYANRLPAQFEQTIGPFANFIPFRYLLDGNTDIDFLIDSTKAQHKQALSYQQLPFRVMLQSAQTNPDLSFNSLIQIQFVNHCCAGEPLSLFGLDVEPLERSPSTIISDLAVHVDSDDQEIVIRWQYNIRLFSRERISEMQRAFVEFIEYHLSYMQNKVLCYRFAEHFHGGEKNTSNGLSTAHFAPYVSCVERIEHQGTVRPEAFAISHGTVKLSYAELIIGANRVIAGIQKVGINVGDRIAVYMEQSIEQMIVMYAVMRAGCVYVPLNPNGSSQHSAYICQDAEARALICATHQQPDEFISFDTEVLFYELLIACCESPRLQKLEQNNSAYVIYTASTGKKPKGVQVPHGSIYYALQVNRQVFEFQSLDKMPIISTVTSSHSLLEMLVPLLSGGTVQILNAVDKTDISSLIEHTQKATVMHFIPKTFISWLEVVKGHRSLYPQLRLILISGDVVPASLLQRVKSWRTDLMVRVLYGLTESCSHSSSYLSHQQQGDKYIIGKPHPQVDFYVMNRFGQPQLSGMAGELYIGGLSIASGYIGPQQSVNGGFLFDKQAKQRLFKTGDRVRLLPCGNYQFLGRIEPLLDYRGTQHRDAQFEASRVECLAYQIDGVKQCIAMVVNVEHSTQVLVLYYSRYADGRSKDLVEQDIKTIFAQQLSQSMRPSVLFELDFCYHPNGKINRDKLPLPSVEASYIAPSTDTERYLQQLWCKALVLSKISVTVNFFHLGGDSLLMSQLQQKINQHFTISLSLKQLFIAANIRDCAQLIDEKISYRKLCRLLT